MPSPVALPVAGHVPARLVLAIALALAAAPAWAAPPPDEGSEQPPRALPTAGNGADGDVPAEPPESIPAPAPPSDVVAPDAVASGVTATVADPPGAAGSPPWGEAPTAEAEPPATGDVAVDVDAVVATDDAAGAPAAEADPEDEASEAEADFEALYGDVDAGGEAGEPGVYDPWEPYNRRVHTFNNAVDARVARPLAKAYVRVVPPPVRTGVSNFFNNLGQPVSAANALLQGKPKQAAHSLGRFVVNSTLGIGGVFDPATAANLENRSEDFGQTLGVWGWKRSRYVELPLFGPRTLRDIVGMAGDAPLAPLRAVQADKVRVPLQGLQLVDMRMQLLSTDALREGAADDYELVRDAWSQRRAYQISGESGEGELPDYLLDEDDPTVVPVGAMPVTGG